MNVSCFVSACNKTPSKANINAPCDTVCLKVKLSLFQMSDSCSSKVIPGIEIKAKIRKSLRFVTI